MELKNLFNAPLLNDVFTPGGQPSITYVGRKHLGLESSLTKATSQRNIIVSLTGATKSGKTVLCRSVLDAVEYVWIDGGQIRTEEDVWKKVLTELNEPSEIKNVERDDTGLKAEGSLGADVGLLGTGGKFRVTFGGSHLSVLGTERTLKPDAMQSGIDVMVREGITLVIDDFHYVPEACRGDIIKSLKGAVFRGLGVVLLSTPHRAFDAIKAESEITGRFRHVAVPDWGINDLKEIATAGFKALNVRCPEQIISGFAEESQGSPLLMQQFCWNTCYDCGITKAELKAQTIQTTFDTKAVYREVARDAGLPTYEKLAKGPQTRTDRIMRPLKNGQEVDIYQAILLAIAATGPKEKISYNEIRGSLNDILADKIPQKLEVSNALKHLANKDQQENSQRRAVDWDEEELELVITDPFFRFYLRWEIAPRASSR